MSPSSGGGTAPPQLNASDVSTGQWAEPTASSVPLAVVVNSGVTKAATAESSSSTSQPVKIDKHDKRSLAYVWRSLVAGGVAGCVAKTVIAPLDRVKILFQTNNPKFQRHSGTFWGVFSAAKEIHGEHGLRGLFQGHLATLLRIFPYAAIKFMAFEQYKLVLMPTPEQETSLRHLLAGSLAGVTSVFFTYPLELIRVRMAVTTTNTGGLFATVSRIFHEPNPLFDRIGYHLQPPHPEQHHASAHIPQPHSQSHLHATHVGKPHVAAATATTTSWPRTVAVSLLNDLKGVANFYRGFLPTIYGMIPYAGVSFWTYDVMTQIMKTTFGKWALLPAGAEPPKKAGKKGRASKEHLKVWAQLTAGAIAGAVSQTVSYPLEVIRRNMQVAGSPELASAGTKDALGRHHPSHYRTTWETAKHIYSLRGFRGFFVGLSIGYLKVTPMVAVSFAVYEQMKRVLSIE